MAEYTLLKDFNTTAVFTVDAENSIQAAQKFQEIIDRISNEIFDTEYKNDAQCNFYGYDIEKVTEFLKYDINDSKLKIYDSVFNSYDLSGIEIPQKENDDIETDNVKFIWGKKCSIDMSDSAACLYTMNSIDITYDFEEKKYCLGIEESYDFNGNEMEKVSHYESLCNEFKKYLISLGFSESVLEQTDKCSVFDIPYPITIVSKIMPLKANTLLDLYYKFVLFIKVLKALF